MDYCPVCGGGSGEAFACPACSPVRQGGYAGPQDLYQPLPAAGGHWPEQDPGYPTAGLPPVPDQLTQQSSGRPYGLPPAEPGFPGPDFPGPDFAGADFAGPGFQGPAHGVHPRAPQGYDPEPTLVWHTPPQGLPAAPEGGGVLPLPARVPAAIGAEHPAGALAGTGEPAPLAQAGLTLPRLRDASGPDPAATALLPAPADLGEPRFAEPYPGAFLPAGEADGMGAEWQPDGWQADSWQAEGWQADGWQAEGEPGGEWPADDGDWHLTDDPRREPAGEAWEAAEEPPDAVAAEAASRGRSRGRRGRPKRRSRKLLLGTATGLVMAGALVAVVRAETGSPRPASASDSSAGTGPSLADGSSGDSDGSADTSAAPGGSAAGTSVGSPQDGAGTSSSPSATTPPASGEQAAPPARHSTPVTHAPAAPAASRPTPSPSNNCSLLCWTK